MCLKIITSARKSLLPKGTIFQSQERTVKSLLSETKTLKSQCSLYGKSYLATQPASCQYLMDICHRKLSYCFGLLTHTGMLRNRKRSVLLNKDSSSLTLLRSQYSKLIFMRYHSNYNSMGAFIEDISNRIRNDDSCLNNLSIWIDKLHSSVYHHFSFKLSCKDENNQKRQIQYNIYNEDLKAMYVNNPHFHELIIFLQLNLKRIDITHYPVLFNFLAPLLDSEHPLFQSLYLACMDSLPILSLHEIAIFLESDYFCRHSKFHTAATILEIIKPQITDQHFSDFDSLLDFCEIFRHIGGLMSRETFSKGALSVMNRICDGLLIHQPVHALHAFCKFPFELWGDLDEILQAKVMEIERKVATLQFSLSELDIDSCLYIGTVLDPLLSHPFLEAKRLEFFKEFLEEENKKVYDPLQSLKFYFLFYTMDIRPGFMLRLYGKEYQHWEACLQEKLSRVIDDCDNFWLIQMFKVCSIRNMPGEITRKIHRKVEELVDNCSLEHQRWLLDENEGELALLLFNSSMKKFSRNGDRVPSSELVNVSSALEDHACSKTMAIIGMQQITDNLLNNHTLIPKEMERAVNMVNRMDSQALMYLITVLNKALLKGSQSPDVNRQIRQLVEAMRQAFQDKLSSVSFLPPFSLLPKHYFFPIHPSTYLATLSSTTVTHLIKSLGKSTSGLEERACLRAITLLDKASNRKPSYVPETFENLLKFVYNYEDVPVHSVLSLVKTISLAGYQPLDIERFKHFCVQFCHCAMQNNLLRPLEQLQLMYHMTLLEIFDNVNQYMSVDTMLTLDKEINNLRIFNPSSATVFEIRLFQLVQNVIVGCPHLSVQQFVNVPRISKRSEPTRERLHGSVKRIFKDSSLVGTAVFSPYNHTIDVLVSLDWDGFSYELKNPYNLVHNLNPGVTSHRLAFLHLNPSNYCMIQSGRLTGTKLASIRQLQVLGYTVIKVRYSRLQMMDLQSDDSLDEYVKSRIQMELGVDGMFV